MIPSDAIPDTWARAMTTGVVTIGLDTATTEGKKSNPSAICVMEKLPGLYVQRLSLRWKTASEEVSRQVIDLVVSQTLARSRNLRALCIDASNEVFFAQSVRAMLRGRVQAHLIKGGEAIDWKGARYNFKTLLGSLYVNAFEDGFMALARAEWLLEDHRLVVREAGSFRAPVGEDGAHADTFDAGRLALWGHERKGGPMTATAVPVGSHSAASAGEMGPLKKLWSRLSGQATNIPT